MNTILLGIIGAQEILLILLVVLVFFGGKKIPELMKGLGKGVKEYKKVMNTVEEEVSSITTPDKMTEPKEENKSLGAKEENKSS
ncbi:MAG: twin-arginine translocase TatA/TatE family subunit [Prevotellaceae bacterium]|jgi:sec-independent protein translocase protein TatA|nr:twin-arginine translocase TatA/TatE family subunit [Prevotellaceae bacterium]